MHVLDRLWQLKGGAIWQHSSFLANFFNFPKSKGGTEGLTSLTLLSHFRTARQIGRRPPHHHHLHSMRESIPINRVNDN